MSCEGFSVDHQVLRRQGRPVQRSGRPGVATSGCFHPLGGLRVQGSDELVASEAGGGQPTAVEGVSLLQGDDTRVPLQTVLQQGRSARGWPISAAGRKPGESPCISSRQRWTSSGRTLAANSRNFAIRPRCRLKKSLIGGNAATSRLALPSTSAASA